MLTTPPSDFANLVSLPSADKSVTLLGIRCGSLKMLRALKPNFFPSVPRFLNRIYQVAMASGNVPEIKGALFRKALEAKLDRLHRTGAVTHAFWDRLVFHKVIISPI